MNADTKDVDWTGVDDPNFMGPWVMMATRPVNTFMSSGVQLSLERENRLQSSLLRLQERLEQADQALDDWVHIAVAWAALAAAGWGTVLWLVFR